MGTNVRTLARTHTLDHVPQIRTVNAAAATVMNQELITPVENGGLTDQLLVVVLSLEILLSPELQDLPV